MELVRHVFTYPGVKYCLSEKICQDPLEKFFGCQRQRGCVNENPNVAEFVKNTQALRVCGNLSIEIKGNNRGSSRKRVLTYDKENTSLSLKEEESIKILVTECHIIVYSRAVSYRNIYFWLFSLVQRLFDFCSFLFSSHLYISSHDFVKENP